MNEAGSPARNIERDAAAALMEPLTDLVVRAGAAIMAVNRRAMTVAGKADGSPVTDADLAADHIIGDGLAQLMPAVPALGAFGETAIPRQFLPHRPARRHQGIRRRQK